MKIRQLTSTQHNLGSDDAQFPDPDMPIFITNTSRSKHKRAHSSHRRPSCRGIELGRQLDMRGNPHLIHILLVHSLTFRPIDNKTKQRFSICIPPHTPTTTDTTIQSQRPRIDSRTNISQDARMDPHQLPFPS